MNNNYLKNQVLEVLQNQIRMNDPKCVNTTLKRLVAEGSSEKNAKEMIAAILLEEMYDVLKDGQPFDEKQFEGKLNILNHKMTNLPEPNQVGLEALTAETLLNQIAWNTGRFPKVILEELINRKSEMTSLLLNVLIEARDHPEKYKNNAYFAHIYAAYLLAQFRAKEAYPILVDLMSLPAEESRDLFGDSLLDTGGRLLASVCGSDLSLIKELIEDEYADPYMRVNAIDSLVILVLNGIIDRSGVMSYFSKLIEEPSFRNNSVLLSLFVSSCCRIHPDELYEDIKKCYKEQLVDEFVIELDDVNSVMDREKYEVLAAHRDNVHLKLIENMISDLEWWACFEEDYKERKNKWHFMNEWQGMKQVPVTIKSTKIGRNDACPCGSGKKYKKCCGR